jgi:hypothetical protein
MNRVGKVKRTGRVFGSRKDRLIAIVTLKKGQTIAGFDFPADKPENSKDKAKEKTKALPAKAKTNKDAK